MRKEVPRGSPRLHSPATVVPFLALGALVAGFFYAVTRVLVPHLAAAEAGSGGPLPGITRILPFIARNPFPCSLAILLAGGAAIVFAPRDAPLRITAWFAAAAFILGLWGTLLALVPEACCCVEVPAP